MKADAPLTVLIGDAEKQLATLPAGIARCCVTSPPYWGLRDYGADGQIGLEDSLDEWVSRLVSVFEQVRRVLTDDGTLWLNLGDAYNAGTSAKRNRDSTDATGYGKHGYWNNENIVHRVNAHGLKPKDLIGQPWMVAFALRAAGWYLRAPIIWGKNNPMPESVTDRPTTSHEYIFLLAKSPRYFYNAEAIAEPCSPNTHARVANQKGSTRGNGDTKTNGPMKAVVRNGLNPKAAAVDGSASGIRPKQNDSMSAALTGRVLVRNSRTVWRFPTQGYRGAHFATFPEELPKRCILAGSERGDLILDPFGGTFTTAIAARMTGRRALMVELNPTYAEQGRTRYTEATGIFGGAA